jgi:hypothetical protein
VGQVMERGGRMILWTKKTKKMCTLALGGIETCIASWIYIPVEK